MTRSNSARALNSSCIAAANLASSSIDGCAWGAAEALFQRSRRRLNFARRGGDSLEDTGFQRSGDLCRHVSDGSSATDEPLVLTPARYSPPVCPSVLA